MKYLKIFAFLLGAVLMTACGSDDEKTSYNSASGVEVSMAQAQIRFRESAGIVNVPVKVTGESNGYVTVVCEVKEYNEDPEGEPAMDDVHYLLTSKTLTIAAGDSIGYFEIKTVDDFEINPSRYFTITLVDVKGASLGAPTTTIVELKDNDSNPYERLAGEWYINCLDSNGAPQSLKVSIDVYDEDNLGYEKSLIMKGLFGGAASNDDPSTADLGYKYDVATGTGSVSLKLGQTLYKYSDYNVMLLGLSDDGYVVSSGTLIFEWNEDFSELELTSHAAGFNLAGLYIEGGYYQAVGLAFNVTGMSRNSK